jgi:hypothetical protein
VALFGGPNGLMRPGIAAAEPQNELAPRPTAADAYDANAQAVERWLTEQQQISADRGLWQGGSVLEGGGPTGAGWVDAAGQYTNALMMGTTAPGARGAMDNPAFAKWFGKSHVVDEAGKPLTLYHQTASENMPSIYERGFTTDPSVARARLSDDQVPNGIFFKPDERNIGVGSHDPDKITQVPVHLAIQKPLVVNDREALAAFVAKANPEYAKHAAEANAIDAGYNRQFETLWKGWDDIPSRRGESSPEVVAHQKKMDDLLAEWQQANVDKATTMRGLVDNVLREHGYDGVVIHNDAGSMGRKTKTYIALDPTQVKSATINRGTYDPRDPRITYGVGGLMLGGGAAAGAQGSGE